MYDEVVKDEDVSFNIAYLGEHHDKEFTKSIIKATLRAAAKRFEDTGTICKSLLDYNEMAWELMDMIKEVK